MKFKAIEPPLWLSRSAVYQINPRTFCAGGTIADVTEELPFLKELGFRIMYLCPVFEEDDSDDKSFWSNRQLKSETDNPKNPYRMNDYFKIDPEYGTEDDLRQFVDTAHKLGMRVLLDLVYAHIGPNAPILKKHPEFAKQDKDGNIIYSTWHFPFLDYTCEGLREYMWSNMLYYIGEFDVDGFRCDVGDYIPVDFWNEARRRMHSIKPESVLINEGHKWDYLLTAFDSSYCFAWHDNMHKLFGGEITAAAFRENIKECWAALPDGARLLIDMENHDTATDWDERIELFAGNDGMEMIQVMNYLMRGIPMVYCGNELADDKRISMFANRFHMGKFEVTDRSDSAKAASLRRQNVFKKLNQLKYESDILCYGDVLWRDDLPENILSFERNYKSEQILFVGNVGSEPVKVKALDGKIILSNKAELCNASELILEPHGYIAIIENGDVNGSV